MEQKDTLVIELKNTLPVSFIEDIRVVTDFTQTQIKHIEQSLTKEWDYKKCPEIPVLLDRIHEKSPNSKDDSYTVIYCSQPIFIAHNKAILVFSTALRNKSHEGGKPMGYDVLEIYVRSEGNWQRTGQELLTAY